MILNHDWFLFFPLAHIGIPITLSHASRKKVTHSSLTSHLIFQLKFLFLTLGQCCVFHDFFDFSGLCTISALVVSFLTAQIFGSVQWLQPFSAFVQPHTVRLSCLAIYCS
eukprot:TRINITY_DN30365_c0_g2_i1.p2 TRINITY_DN30365_c0_g2~~TRINITY_DN30365_c0_g2_i1.p2  ORF type:complete len:110 (+),score=5.22 TRINITY_DN30365_c0_g2_i1:1089-1418(+)